MSGAMKFTPAVRERVPLLIGLTSGTGGGKTYSALRIASGIVGPGKRFAGIDTERRRMRHYADDFRFDILDLEPPFSPDRCLKALRTAERAGYEAIVMDSVSHEWAGEGGVLQMHDEAVDRMAGDNASFARKEAMNWPAWREPKERHREFVEGLLQIGVPLVLCFRGKTGLKPGVDPDTRKKVLLETPFKATTSDDLPFELTVLLVLSQDKPGTVDFGQPNKISKPVRPLVRDGQLLDEAFGAGLAAWARGAAGPAAEPAQEGGKRRTLGDAVAELRQRVATAESVEALDAIFAEDGTGKVIAMLNERDQVLSQIVNGEVSARMAALHESSAPVT